MPSGASAALAFAWTDARCVGRDVEIEDERRGRMPLAPARTRRGRRRRNRPRRRLATARSRALRDRDLGVVDADDVPAERREPDRVLPLAACEVERAAGLEVADLGDEEPVRLRRPEVRDAGVARVPVLTPHAASASRRRDTSRRASARRAPRPRGTGRRRRRTRRALRPPVGPTSSPNAQAVFITPNDRPCARPAASARCDVSEIPGV